MDLKNGTIQPLDIGGHLLRTHTRKSRHTRVDMEHWGQWASLDDGVL